ncbi:MAG: glutamine amidotransferase [Clostridiaceae bacterium]|jgi:CobQ-like glutamine amidotransferase family enzyme|nr:glutamine amidotransferase [Clostridiaceae bacterium]
MYELTICHLYPDLLNLYGDRGNIIALTKRCEWRGIRVRKRPVSLNDTLDTEDFDILFIGGGQDYEQSIIQDDLLKGKREAIREAVEAGRVILAVCGGLQLLGRYYRTREGKDIECIGAVDLWTHGGQERLIGNLVFECEFLKSDCFDGLVTGFENHSGKTWLGPGVKPLGRVLKGFGLNGEDGYEGAVYRNTYCTYTHGSLLPKNPALADHLIALALKNKYADFESLEPLDDSIEQAARDTIIKRLTGTRF